jgi:hypothetical protein
VTRKYLAPPQTLVCTKTQASYQRRLEQFGRDLESFRR